MGYFEDNVFSWIQSQRLFEGVRRVLLAVSGGADSVAMAHSLARLKHNHQLLNSFVIGHVNHSLRGAESDTDETFVKTLGNQLDIPVRIRRVDVKEYSAANKLSLETAGRVLRMRALVEMANETGCDTAATGHHADDQAETMVHRLLRGTALRGLCGIRPTATLNGLRFVRPLLNERRAEIESYCRENRLVWREDASNLLCAFTRNHIRHRLLPEVQKQLPDVVEKLVQLAEGCRAAQQRIEAASEAIPRQSPAENTLAYDRTLFTRQSPWVQAELLSRSLAALGGGLRDMTSRHYQALMTEAGTQNGFTAIWPGSITAVANKHNISLSRPPATIAPPPPTEPMALEIGDTVIFGPYRITATLLNRSTTLTDEMLHNKPPGIERIDADKITGRMTLRWTMPGDRFWPMGLGREKKVARFLLDSKTDKENRDFVFVLTDSKKILYLAPLRLDERAKITPKTRQFLEIRIENILTQENR